MPIKIRIATQILGGRLIKSTVTGVPDLPVGSFTLNLDGGDKGVLESKYDLCLSGSKHRNDGRRRRLLRAQRREDRIEAAHRGRGLRARRNGVAATAPPGDVGT